MRIAQIATLGTRVRENGSGSIESLVWLLSRELTEMGHEVTVFAADGSEGPFNVVPTLPGTYGSSGAPDDWQLCEWINLSRAIEQSERFDVIHSHNYLWGVPLQRLSRAPMVHTTHVMPGDDDSRLASFYGESCVTAISRYQWSRYPEGSRAVVYHGVDQRLFTFRPEPENYVCYLGRFMAGKGVLTAIATARAIGIPIVLAGPRNDYFHRHVEPLVDDRDVIYIGGIGTARRDQLLGGARAILYPIRDPEPFGLVMVEAMMCGTPVAAIGIGAVPEIVEEGITGFLSCTAEDFPNAVGRALTLDRQTVRQEAEHRFSSHRMAREYAHIYQSLPEKESCR
jgi:glycosyltransferase involved in cell wall biosynthesis